MPQILRFLVDGQDCVVDVRPDNTLFELMDIVCREWLNDARDGDGEVVSFQLDRLCDLPRRFSLLLYSNL